MSGSRLLNLMSSLDTWEINRLEEMVHSPFFNKDKKCIEFFELLKPFAPGFELNQDDNN